MKLGSYLQKLVFSTLAFSSKSSLHSRQHGFRRGHSRESQLLVTMDDLMQDYDKNQQVDVAVLDLSKAFDTVPHEKLLHKLSHYGIQGQTHRWIRAFNMRDRSQCVYLLNGESSPSGPSVQVASGVPQGTAMGPIMFLSYINDLLPQSGSQSFCLRMVV